MYLTFAEPVGLIDLTTDGALLADTTLTVTSSLGDVTATMVPKGGVCEQLSPPDLRAPRTTQARKDVDYCAYVHASPYFCPLRASGIRSVLNL